MAGWFWVYNATLTQFIGASNDIEHNHSGFPVSLCMHAHKVGQVVPRFTAVWHVRNNPPQVHRAIAVTAEELNDTWLPQWTSNGIFPRLIAGYETDTTGLDSAAGATRFTVLASMGAETDLELGILDSSFFARYWSGVQVQGKAPVPEKKYLDGWYPRSVAFTGWWGVLTHVSTIWQKQQVALDLDGFLYWNLFVEPEAGFLEVHAALESGFAWPHFVSPLSGSTGAGKIAIYRNDRVDRQQLVPGIAVSQLEGFMNHVWSSGHWPLSIQGTAYGPGQRFDVIVAKAGHYRERPRTLTKIRQAKIVAGYQDLDNAKQLVKDLLAPETASARPDQQAAASAQRGSSSLARGSTFQQLEPSSILQKPSIQQAEDLASVAITTYGGGGKLPAFPPATADPFKPVDDWVVRLMKRYSVRAAQLAIARNHKLAHNVGFTWSEPGKWGPAGGEFYYPLTSPKHRFRLASVSKLVTAMAVLKWAELNGVDVFDSDIFHVDNANLGSRLNMTQPGYFTRSLAHLLCHLGNFDQAFLASNIDPFFVANQLGLGLPPAGQPVLTRQQMLQFLQTWSADTFGGEGPFALVSSGTGKAQSPIEYDNWGYERLGDVIMNQTSHTKGYQGWVTDVVFGALNTPRPSLGVQRASDALPMAHREVLYHMSQPVVAASVWDPLLGTDGVLVPGGRAPVSYGGNAYNLGLASGQWSMAAADIVRLMTTLDTPGELLDAAHVQAITQETFAEAQTLGFAVAEATAGVPELGIVASPRVIYHTGSWVTTSTLAFRTDDGMAVALLLNTNFPNALRSPQILELLPLLQFAESLWPDEDLFPDALAQVE